MQAIVGLVSCSMVPWHYSDHFQNNFHALSALCLTRLLLSPILNRLNPLPSYFLYLHNYYKKLN